MPLSSKLVFSPGIAAEKGENINLPVRADTLFVAKKADKKVLETANICAISQQKCKYVSQKRTYVNAMIASRGCYCIDKL